MNTQIALKMTAISRDLFSSPFTDKFLFSVRKGGRIYTNIYVVNINIYLCIFLYKKVDIYLYFIYVVCIQK